VPRCRSSLAGNSVSDNRQETGLATDLINRAGQALLGVDRVGHVAGNVDYRKFLHMPANTPGKSENSPQINAITAEQNRYSAKKPSLLFSLDLCHPRQSVADVDSFSPYFRT
jgi:hypothetical protein